MSDGHLANAQRELHSAAEKIQQARNVDLATLDGLGTKARMLGYAEAATRRALYELRATSP